MGDHAPGTLALDGCRGCGPGDANGDAAGAREALERANRLAPGDAQIERLIERLGAGG